jgi:hypothetical protein
MAGVHTHVRIEEGRRVSLPHPSTLLNCKYEQYNFILLVYTLKLTILLTFPEAKDLELISSIT